MLVEPMRFAFAVCVLHLAASISLEAQTLQVEEWREQRFLQELSFSLSSEEAEEILIEFREWFESSVDSYEVRALGRTDWSIYLADLAYRKSRQMRRLHPEVARAYLREMGLRPAQIRFFELYRRRNQSWLGGASFVAAIPSAVFLVFSAVSPFHLTGPLFVISAYSFIFGFERSLFAAQLDRRGFRTVHRREVKAVKTLLRACSSVRD